MQLQAGACAALPGYGHPAPGATFLPVAAAPAGLRTRQEGKDPGYAVVGRRKLSAARQ